MRFSTTSLRRAKVRRPKGPKKPEFKNMASLERSMSMRWDGFGDYDALANKTWWQRHPGVQLLVTIVIAVGILTGIAYLVPKSTQRYEEAPTQRPKRDVPEMESLAKPGNKGQPTDSSFLNTHYATGGAYVGGPGRSGGGGSGAGNSGRSTSARQPAGPQEDMSFGDGSVTYDHKKKSCEVRSITSNNFADALKGCIDSGMGQ